MVERAKGIADASRVIISSLTAKYLQPEVDTALPGFADNGGRVVAIPAVMQGFDLIRGSNSPGRGGPGGNWVACLQYRWRYKM